MKQQNKQNTASPSATVDNSEIEKFQKMAEEWWSPHGKFKPLHQLNNCRLQYMRDHIANHFGKDKNSPKPLSGLKLLDVGCGGGLIAEPMARLGAKVTGIDASPKTIEVARLHLQNSDVEVDYHLTDIDGFAGDDKFDVVLALELVEHVNDLPHFLSQVAKRVRPGGMLGISTINRTAKAFAFAIVGAEYILRLLPIGTHEWKKFVRPSELVENLQLSGLQPLQMSGMGLDIMRQNWVLRPNDLAVNYIGFFVKDD